ncbi:MAG: hypothetical protein MO852_15395, partial [Candidatus Devosia euplotis]|nr:hypothetical protein [Candidatus Devosia euplotis]
SEDPFARAKVATAKWTGELLNRVYPGHPWNVEVIMSRTGGLIKIQIKGLMPTDRWYVCQLHDVLTDPGGKRTVLRGAGELLERYQLRRGAFSIDHWQAAMNLAPMTGRGPVAPLLD